jgi:hypothetical protein
MEITMRVVTRKTISVEHTITVEKYVTISLSVGSWTKIRTNARRTSVEETPSTATPYPIIGDSRDDDDEPKFLMCTICYGEEEGSTATDYTECAIKDIEEEMFDFVKKTKRKIVRPVSSRSMILTTPCRWTYDWNCFVYNEVPKQYEVSVGSKCVDSWYWYDSSYNSKYKWCGKQKWEKCNDSVAMGNGKGEATEWYGDLPLTFSDM